MSYPVQFVYNGGDVVFDISNVEHTFGAGPTDENGDPILDGNGNPIPGDYQYTTVWHSLVAIVNGQTNNWSGTAYTTLGVTASDEDHARDIIAQYGVTIV